MTKHFSIQVAIVVLTLAVGGASAQQVSRPDSTRATQPAFATGKGPVVAIDEAHQNTHTIGSAQFRGFGELLQRDGYRVRSLTESIAGASLTGIDVLVVSGPGGWAGPDASLSDGEVAALIQWIRDGGALLLILDHMPAPRNGARLAAAVGVSSWHDGYTLVEMRDSLPVGPILFWRADSFPAGLPAVGPTGPAGGMGYQGTDAVLAKHPITEGRNANERVQKVATFVGSAFQLPSRGEALLTLPERAISFTPKSPGPDVTVDAERTPVGRWLQGAVMKLGKGRVAVFGEAGLFSGGPAADNRLFVLNVLRWLSGVL
ncbi:MAG: hypothetical protein Q7S40_32780 [Opitutaceae bacterium]|nr:hypothetical protein [Opitutaceae bacterium]